MSYNAMPWLYLRPYNTRIVYRSTNYVSVVLVCCTQGPGTVRSSAKRGGAGGRSSSAGGVVEEGGVSRHVWGAGIASVAPS